MRMSWCAWPLGRPVQLPSLLYRQLALQARLTTLLVLPDRDLILLSPDKECFILPRSHVQNVSDSWMLQAKVWW